METITKEQLLQGMLLGKVRVATSPNDDGVVCLIQENASLQGWFYFDQNASDETSPAKYLESVGADAAVSQIMEALEEIRIEDPEEYRFYQSVLFFFQSLRR